MDSLRSPCVILRKALKPITVDCKHHIHTIPTTSCRIINGPCLYIIQSIGIGIQFRNETYPALRDLLSEVVERGLEFWICGVRKRRGRIAETVNIVEYEGYLLEMRGADVILNAVYCDVEAIGITWDAES